TRAGSDTRAQPRFLRPRPSDLQGSTSRSNIKTFSAASAVSALYVICAQSLALPIRDHPPGADRRQPAGERRAAHPRQLTVLALRELALAACVPGRRKIQHERIDDTYRDGGEFDVEEGITDIFRRLGGEQ